jgi:hypothetical protein
MKGRERGLEKRTGEVILEDKMVSDVTVAND